MSAINSEEEYMTVRRQWMAVCNAIRSDKTVQRRNALEYELNLYDALHHGDRKGAWMTTYTGRRFWPADPRPEEVDVRDIAHALSRLPRYNAHTYEVYSVAQHSVMGSWFIEEKYALHFLLHDAPECYLGDVVSPVKQLLGDDFARLEQQVLDAICDRFDVAWDSEIKRAVKEVDLRMLATEIRDLTPAGVSSFILPHPPLSLKIEECWDSAKAERLFLDRFAELTSE